MASKKSLARWGKCPEYKAKTQSLQDFEVCKGLEGCKTNELSFLDSKWGGGRVDKGMFLEKIEKSKKTGHLIIKKDQFLNL